VNTLSSSVLSRRIPSRAIATTVIPASYSIDEAPQEGNNLPALRPVSTDDRSANPLRPTRLDEMVGQPTLRRLLRRIIDGARDNRAVLDHVLLAGSSGTGKTTLAHIIANELDRDCYQVDAPVSHELLQELGAIMRRGDILFVDEIHQQVAPDRRGASKAAVAETFYHVMEDRKLATARGVTDFPEITIIGATTDTGLLPEPFLARFPLKPHLERYSEADMTELAQRNADALGISISTDGATALARASRNNPRQMNSYVRNANTLYAPQIDTDVAREIIVDLNATSLDGLTADMQGMLRYLLSQERYVRATGETRYQASVNSIATAIGKSRDTKAVALYVEPYLIERGFVQVAHGGRILTPQGVDRARQLQRG
jgi:Holliday junction DNA helicase RuvB